MTRWELHRGKRSRRRAGDFPPCRERLQLRDAPLPATIQWLLNHLIKPRADPRVPVGRAERMQGAVMSRQ